MADTELRANSLRIRFERGVAEPADSEIFKFMKSKMGLKSDKLLSMYKDRNEMSVIIKFKAEEDMRNTLRDLPETLTFEYNKYESTEVKLSSANVIVRYVRLFNLPPEIEDREIAQVMQRFGKIVRMVREKYGEETGFPIWTSVRGVYLELKEGIEMPATVYIRNVRARVSYEGIINKCYLCGSTDHLKAECPEKQQSVNDRLGQHQVSSYSGIVKGGERWLKRQQAKPSGTDKDGMINLGQGLPKRPSVTQQNLDQSERIGEEAKQGTENGLPGDQQPRANNDNEHSVAAMDQQEQCHDTTDLTVDGAGGGEFIKVTNKRGRKQQKSADNKEGTSDSDESPLGKVHRDQNDPPGMTVGTLSAALDRITRSKSKQKSMSDDPSRAIENVSAEPELT